MRRLFIAALIAAALTATAGAASARVLPILPRPVSATSLTLLTGDPDSGYGTPPVWAIDSMWRTETVTKGAQVTGTDCGLAASAACWAYTSNLTDEGWFTTIRGAGTPNQSCAGCAGEHIRRQVTGTLHGTYAVTFYASSPSPDASLVAFFHDDHGVAAAAPFTSTTWAQQFFPAGTAFGAFTGGAYKWVYRTAGQKWTDSSANGDGDQPGDGNITG